MKTEDIVSLTKELVARDTQRHAKYDFLIEAAGGDYETRRLEAVWRAFQSFLGKVDVPMDRETFEFRLNLIPSIIRSSRAFIATVPTVRCPPADPSDEDSRKIAEKLERVYGGFWQSSLIGKRMNQMGYWNPTLGNTIGVVWPDTINKRPMLQMRSPYGFYPVIRDVDGYDLSCAVFTTRYPRRQVKAMYPNWPLTGEGLCSVTQYIGEDELVTVIDDSFRAKTVKNKWKFVPIVIIPNETFGEGPWGDSDIEWVIPLQAERNYRSTIQNALLAMMQMQPIAIEDGSQLDEEIHMGALDAILVKPGGRVYRVNPPTVPFQAFQAQQELTDLIDRVGQVPPAMRGEFAGNVLTGKGVSALQGPSQMAYQVKANEIYPAMAVLNKMAMRMWEALWGDQEHTVYSLPAKGGMSVEKFTPKEFEGWFENIVSVDMSSYFDLQQRFMVNLQAVQNRLKSRLLAASETPGVEDYVADQAQVAKELQDDMDMQAANEARAQNNIQPPMGEPGATASYLKKGYMGETPAPAPIGGFAAPEGAVPENLLASPGAEQPAAEGGILQDMIEFFSAIPLKGKVWLAGGIVSNPGYSPQSPDYAGIDVYLESPGDKSAINTTMRTEYPEVWGHLTYHTGAPSEQEPSILVFDPEGQASPDMGELEQAFAGAGGGAEPGGAMPPEMQGMTGAPPA